MQVCYHDWAMRAFSQILFNSSWSYHSHLYTLCYWQHSKIPPKLQIQCTIISKHLLLLLNEQRSMHFLLYVAYFLLTSNIRLAVTLSSSSEGRNSLHCTTMNHTDCVLSFNQVDKAHRPVTSCGSTGARFSAALFLSRVRAPSLPTPATSHQVLRSPYNMYILTYVTAHTASPISVRTV